MAWVILQNRVGSLLHMSTALVPAFDTCLALTRWGFPQHTMLGWIGRGPLSSPVLMPRASSGGRRRAVAAPTLDEVLARLPATVVCTVPHPIYGTVECSHSLRMEIGEQATLGYHLPGSFEVRYRTGHARAVEAAARLFLTLRASGILSLPEVPTVHSPLQIAHAA